MARILEAGRNAPSACNYQPQRVLVLQSDEALTQMRSITHWAFNLPPSWKVVAMMPMGYPAENARPSNWHFRRKETEDLYRFI